MHGPATFKKKVNSVFPAWWSRHGGPVAAAEVQPWHSAAAYRGHRQRPACGAPQVQVHPKGPGLSTTRAPQTPVSGDGWLSLALGPSAAQQAELDAYLAALQDRGPSDYRNWLTPEQFADRYGVSASDLDQITGWLEARGFTIRTWHPAATGWPSAYGGPGAADPSRLKSIASRWNGALHFANTADPSVPAGSERGDYRIRGLHEFREFGLRGPTSRRGTRPDREIITWRLPIWRPL